MLHGKKGFDRIVYAFKNLLTTPVTWLFHDLSATCEFMLNIIFIYTNVKKPSK